MKKAYLLALMLLTMITACASVEPGLSDKNDSFMGHLKLYSFKLYKGGLIQDNVRRLAAKTGYQIHVVNLGAGCDLYIEAGEIESGSKEGLFKKLVEPNFDIKFHEVGKPTQMLVLTYTGAKSLLKGCYQ